MVGRLLAPLAAGSHLVVSHATAHGRAPGWEPVSLLYQQAAAVTARSRAQIEALFAGLALVDPGVVWLPLWRPEPGVVAELARADLDVVVGATPNCAAITSRSAAGW